MTSDEVRTRLFALEAALKGIAAQPAELCKWCGGCLTTGWWTRGDDSGIEHYPDCPAAIAAAALSPAAAGGGDAAE